MLQQTLEGQQSGLVRSVDKTVKVWDAASGTLREMCAKAYDTGDVVV